MGAGRKYQGKKVHPFRIRLNIVKWTTQRRQEGEWSMLCGIPPLNQSPNCPQTMPFYLTTWASSLASILLILFSLLLKWGAASRIRLIIVSLMGCFGQAPILCIWDPDSGHLCKHLPSNTAHSLPYRKSCDITMDKIQLELRPATR